MCELCQILQFKYEKRCFSYFKTSLNVLTVSIVCVCVCEIDKCVQRFIIHMCVEVINLYHMFRNILVKHKQ